MNQEISAGQWRQMRGALKSWWGRLTDDDFDWIGGEKDKLIGLIQQKYGQTREEAQQEVDRRFDEYGSQYGGTLSDVSARAQEFGSQASARVRDAVDSARSYLQDKNYADLAEDATDLVRKYPLPSLLIGIGIGYLLARSLRD